MAPREDIAFGVAALSKMTDRDLNNIIAKVFKSRKGGSTLKSMMRSVIRSALKSTIRSANRASRGKK